MIYAVIIGICLLLVLSYVCSHQYLLSPSILVSAIWIIMLVLYVLLPHDLFPIGKQTLLCISLWCGGIVLSSLFVQSFPTPVGKIQASNTIRDLYLLLSVLSFPFLLYWAYTAIVSGTESWMLNLRMAAIGRGSSGEAYTPFYTIIWQVSYALELIYFERKKWWRLLLSGLFFLSFGFITMSKMFILSFFLFTVCILFFKRKIQLKHLLLGVGVIIVGLIGLHFLRQNQQATEDNVTSFVELYLLSSLSAFETLEPCSASHFGENAFRIFYAIAYRLGISDIEPINPILEFIHVPVYTNTYTTMYPFFVDFGYWGVGLFALVIGGLFGLTFRKAQDGSLFSLVIYAYFMHIIIMQFAGDMLFTNLAGLLKYVIVAMIPFLVEKEKILYVRDGKG